MASESKKNPKESFGIAKDKQESIKDPGEQSVAINGQLVAILIGCSTKPPLHSDPFGILSGFLERPKFRLGVHFVRWSAIG